MPPRAERAVHIAKRGLGAIAFIALLRTLAYAAVDAFAFHIFGDPRPRLESRR